MRKKQSFPFGWLSLASVVLLLVLIFILPLIFSLLNITWFEFWTVRMILLVIFTLASIVIEILGIIKNTNSQKTLSIICLVLSIIVSIILLISILTL